MFLCKTSVSPRCAPFFCRPEPQGEGSLGTGVPREDMDGLSPRALFLSPRGVSRGVFLMKRHPEIPNEVRRDAVPSEARDASLTLGTTGWGLSLRDIFFCRPEALAEGSPIVKEGISRYARNDKMGRGCLANARQDRVGAVTPSHFFVTPSASEGSLGTGVPQEDRKGLAHRAARRGVPRRLRT